MGERPTSKDDKVTSSKQTEEQTSKRGRKAGAILFPRDPLSKILALPEAIWKQNAGNPFDIIDVAKAVGQSPTSSNFIRQLASSYRYGLTEGSTATKVITLTPLGSAIVAPVTETDVNAKLREALVHPDIFRKVYTWMDRKPIPREDVFRNTLIKGPELSGFGIPEDDVDEFIKVFQQNIADYGLADDVKGTKYLRLDKLSPAVSAAKAEESKEGQIIPETTVQEQVGAVAPQRIETPQEQIPKLIFVAHGKNKKPLEQLERILNKFKVPYKVAVEEPHSGRPISAKVAEIMTHCTSGIFIFTADEIAQDAEGNKILRPSDNVVYELGAASVLYGNKIVIFKEEGVSFASDFSDIGYISFEKDKLDTKAADLMLELINLGFMQLTPT